MTLDAAILATCSGGIIMSPESVRAIRDLRKTQTRRLCKQAVDHGGELAKSVHPDGSGTGWIAWFGAFEVSAEETVKRYPGAEGFLPRYRVGRRYYVKETWAGSASCPLYRADNQGLKCAWGSSMRMPKYFARYVIKVTDARVERLQDITEEDARAEGMLFHDGRGVGHTGWRHSDGYGFVRATAKEAFAVAWDTINRKRASWASNPWVWAYTFKLVGGAS